MSEAARRALELAAGIKESAAAIHNSFPAEVRRPQDEPVLPFSLVKGTRGYIEKIVHQINGSYVATCYDACAVMARRLLETLIIEAFEHHRIDHKIKDKGRERELFPPTGTGATDAKGTSLEPRQEVQAVAA